MAPEGARGEGEAVRRIAEAVEELGLRPAQKDDVERSLAEALRKASQREMRERRNAAVFVRLLVSDTAPVETGTGVQQDRGWGFFLLERQNGSHRVIELYLYQESAGAR